MTPPAVELPITPFQVPMAVGNLTDVALNWQAYKAMIMAPAAPVYVPPAVVAPDARVSGLESRMGMAEANIGRLELNVSRLEGSISGLQSDMSGLKAEVAGFDRAAEDITDLLGTMASLTASYPTMRVIVAPMRPGIGVGVGVGGPAAAPGAAGGVYPLMRASVAPGVKERLETLWKLPQITVSDWDAAMTRMTAAESTAADARNLAERGAIPVTALEDRLQGLRSEFTDLRTRVSGIDGTVSGLSTNYAALIDRVDRLEAVEVPAARIEEVMRDRIGVVLTPELVESRVRVAHIRGALDLPTLRPYMETWWEGKGIVIPAPVNVGAEVNRLYPGIGDLTAMRVDLAKAPGVWDALGGMKNMWKVWPLLPTVVFALDGIREKVATAAGAWAEAAGVITDPTKWSLGVFIGVIGPTATALNALSSAMFELKRALDELKGQFEGASDLLPVGL